MEEQEKTLEILLGEIEEMIENMQERDVSLEDSFALYEQGIRKLKLCNEKIDTVEKKMLILEKQSEQ